MKRGDTFLHARWLDEQNQPAVCTVTRVADGVVYYKQNHGGKPSGHSYYFQISDAAKHIH